MMKIGQYTLNSPYLLAPMAGVSEMPFRRMALEFGAGLATTELISAKGLVYKNDRSKQYMTYDPSIEDPFSVQLFGGEADMMAQAAVMAIEKGAQIIDINMGCPVKKVTKTGSGSALLSDIQRAANLVSTMRKAMRDDVPLTVKIRTGWDQDHINCTDMGQALQEAGCAALAMHARTRAQGYSGTANWDLIGELVDAVDIPIIGNGDVFSADDARKMTTETGCAGVMIGRGALGNPWIFRSLAENRDASPTPAERRDVLIRHLKEHIEFHMKLAEGTVSRHVPARVRAIRAFRNHLVWYSKGIANAGEFRAKIMTVDDETELYKIIDDFFLNQSDGLDDSNQDDGVDYRQAFG